MIATLPAVMLADEVPFAVLSGVPLADMPADVDAQPPATRKAAR